MVGAGVGDPDPAEPELDFQRDSALTSWFGGEDGPVVAEHLRRDAPAVERRREHLPHLGAGEDPPGDRGDADSGVVVEDVEDLHLGAVGELPVGDVGLPAFVGLVGGEPSPGRAGPFLWLRRHEPAANQDPPDRRHRRW
jgi:hypothetical protein